MTAIPPHAPQCAVDAGSRDADPPLAEVAPGFAALGVTAFTTTRARGSYAWQSSEPAHDVFARWNGLSEELATHMAPPGRGAGAPRLASAHQVHGDHVVVHGPGWDGWLRCAAADGHVSLTPGTAMAVTLADCVPVFIAHPAGATAIVHSGWKGTVAGITARAITRLANAGFAAGDLLVHCGPAICGRCYEVSPDVFARLTKRRVDRPTPVDLRALIARDAQSLGVRDVTISPSCTMCDNARFFSHRAGDAGRQLGVIAARLVP